MSNMLLILVFGTKICQGTVRLAVLFLGTRMNYTYAV